MNALTRLLVVPCAGVQSIITVKGDGPPEDQDDGVVECPSAHIYGVESEMAVGRIVPLHATSVP